MSAHRIHPLPPDVVAKIKSSTAITHLNGVILELVKNALDANAHTIYVTVDYQRGGCVVEDDGIGIPREEFEIGGGLGQPHHTSKLHCKQDVYGHKGSFLASLSSLSLLTIASHHARQSSTNAIIFHHAASVARMTPAPAHQELKFRSHGTRVTVNDLFGNMPVRVKSRALALQKPDELDRQWDELRHLLVAVAMANDSLKKLVLSDVKRDKTLRIRPTPGCLWTDAELSVERVASILTQAGLVDFQSTSGWNSVSACVPDLSIHAAVSLTPCPSKKFQFISIGMTPMFPRNNANLLFNEVNRLFSSSDFGATGGSVAVPTSSMESFDANPMGKSVNKWPMFYLRIHMDGLREVGDEEEEIPESDQSLQRILDVLGAMVSEFLVQHNLRPRAGKRKRQASRKPAESGESQTPDPATGPSGGSLRVSATEDALCGQVKIPRFSKPGYRIQPFENWSRIKSAKESFYDQSTFTRRKDLVDLSRKARMQDLPEKSIEKAAEGSSEAIETSTTDRDGGDGTVTGADSMLPWVDPYTGRTHLVNSRTGQSMSPVTTTPAGTELDRRPYSTGSLRRLKALEPTRRPRSANSTTTHKVWVDSMLRRWDNPVFSRSEQPINVFDGGHEGTSVDGRPGSGSNDLCGFESFGLSKFQGKLHRQDLHQAEIISQVDRKFILAKMRPSWGTSSVLVLIDQHAADERCRVEQLLEELLSGPASGPGVQTITVDPIVFEIARREASLFRRYQSFFWTWGVGYTVEQTAEDRLAAVLVTTLPALIAERCRTEPHLVTDLIRGEIWRREEDGRGADEGVSTDSSNWVARIHGCPKGIVDLLNSRACRTAIMFNDALTVDECRSLVQRLSRCVLPFQCAHGRPSMIPVLDITREMDEDGLGETDEGLEFVEAYKKWH